MSADTIRRIAIDPGFNNFRAAEAQNGRFVKVKLIPSVVGIGTKSIGSMGVGLIGSSETALEPLEVKISGDNYLVGHNVHRFTRPIQRLEFERNSKGEDLQALMYAAWYEILDGATDQRIALLIGQPVNIIQSEAHSTKAKEELKEGFLGSHTFEVNGRQVTITVETLALINQPVGSYFDVTLDVTGGWAKDKPRLNNVLVLDGGFNTFDIFAIEQGGLNNQYSGARTLGMRRPNEIIQGEIMDQYGVELSFRETDRFIMLYTQNRPTVLEYGGGSVDITRIIRQALDSTYAEIRGFVESKVSNGQKFPHVILTGGGMRVFGKRFLEKFPRALIPQNPVCANARGLAKYAIKAKALAV